MVSVIDTLYDDNDGESKTGHHTSLFAPEFDFFGSSLSLTKPGISVGAFNASQLNLLEPIDYNAYTKSLQLSIKSSV